MHRLGLTKETWLTAGLMLVCSAAVALLAALQMPSPPPKPTAALPVSSEEEEVPGRLRVETILQKPELPNGCEVTALAAVLNYCGIPADKCDLADNYLPKEAFVREDEETLYGGDPEKVYAGNPRDETQAFYCFQAPLIQAANSYLRDAGSPLRALDRTGARVDELLSCIDGGTPVIVWCTIGFEPAEQSLNGAWIAEGMERRYAPYTNLHCTVLTGYDDEAFYFADPLGADKQASRVEFLESFEEMGSRAVILA